MKYMFWFDIMLLKRIRSDKVVSISKKLGGRIDNQIKDLNNTI